VRVNDADISSIGPGLLVFVGISVEDDERDARALADKVRKLRVFPDNAGVMNRSVEESNGQVLAVSQFTLLGDVRRGNRPSYITAAAPERAEPLYRAFIEHLRTNRLDVAEGIFRTDMQVELLNDGPVTILVDTRKAF
jgi:D-tyrosyl-tRNA(Tyr) deacylase